MIKRTPTDDGDVKLTFVVPLDVLDAPISVVGDFNDWDPYATPLRRRSNGTRSAAVELPAGERVEFLYLADGGRWLTEDDADELRVTDDGSVNCVVAT